MFLSFKVVIVVLTGWRCCVGYQYGDEERMLSIRIEKNLLVPLFWKVTLKFLEIWRLPRIAA